ncbi:hypothetical protein ACS0TY_014695 [Phlomoides rotata]
MTRSSILRANRVKHNQITQPDFSTQRHADLKSSSKSLKKAQNASNSNSLQSAHHSDGNSVNSSFRRHSSINNGPVMVDKANNSGSKIISENAIPIKPENSSESQRYGSTTFSTSFSMNAQFSGRTVNPLQNQTTKPSGLRMPSPSLSFFSQPKTLVFRDLPMRVTETDVFGSQKLGNLRLQDNLRRTPNTYSRILESTSRTGKAVNSRSECMMTSHVSAIELTKPNSEQNPTHKIQDLPINDIVERVSHKETVLQNIGIEVPPQGGLRQETMHNICKKAIDVYPVDSESCGNGWRNAESGSKQNYAIQDSESIGAIDEPLKGKNTCSSLVLNHGPAQCPDARDDRAPNTLTMQSDCGKTCTLDRHELHMENLDSLEYSLGDTDKRADKDKNVSKIKEGANEQLGVAKQNVSCCNGRIKGLGQRRSKIEIPYFGSKQLCENLLKEPACIEDLTDNLTAGEAHLQNPVFDLTTMACKNDINLVPEVGDDIKQARKDSENICLQVEMEGEKIVKSNTGDRLSPEKKISLQNSQQEHFEKLMFVPDRNDGDTVINTKMPISISPGRKHEVNLRREKTIAQPLRSTGLDFVDNSVSSESCNGLTNLILNYDVNNKGNGNVLLNVTAIGNLSNCLHQDTQRLETDNCSPLPESRIHLRKVGKESACTQDDSADNQLISTMLLKDIESDIDNHRGLWNTVTVLVQSPESNMFNDVFPKQSECTVSASNDRMQTHTKKSADMGSDDNASSSMEDSVTGQSEMCLRNSKGSSLSAIESPLEHESCNDAYDTAGHIAEAMTVPSRVKPLSDTINGEVSENTNCSFSCLHPKLNHDKVEAALDPKSNHQNGLNEKSLSLVLPQNAIPFSDEWLAAIEAAGEDILTRKGGAVQNSPTDKSLPEPSPWSPVKRKNNQIGPFDCTKFTAPSDSNCL